MKYLNLGCGQRFFTDWTNVDFISNDPSVIRHDLNKGIPFDDNSFNVVYSSHVLEHFTKLDAIHFIKECYRVLKYKGLIRIVVPDLEQIVREYLKAIEMAKDGEPQAIANYEWMMLELYDQAVRNISGGNMISYWMQEHIANEDYLKSRFGHEFTNFRSKYVQSSKMLSQEKHPTWVRYFKPVTYKNYLLRLLTGDQKTHDYIAVGKFRLSGEAHQWMYDEYSLKALLKDVGFTKVRRKSAFDSDIKGWDKFATLDVEKGEIRKPDSLFMEAVK